MTRSFFAALALATALPLLILPLYGASHLIAPIPLQAVVFGCWVVTAYGHVMSTLWFGVDTDYAPVIRAHRWRMLGSLAVIPAIMCLLAIADPRLSSWIYAAFLAWQAHHFSRQNFGILSFAAARDRFGPLPRDVSLIINLTAVAGAIGMASMPSIYPRGLPGLPFSSPAVALYGHAAAIVCFIAAGCLIARLVISSASLRRSPTVLLFLSLSGVFFLPSQITGGPQTAFWPYAMAHGAQYLIMMANSSRKSPLGAKGLGLFAAGAVGLGAIAVALPGLALKQAYTGVVMWHFLADARLWRLRDPAVRAIVRRRFAFVFEAPGRADSQPKVGVTQEA